MPPVNAPVQQSAEQSYNEALPHYLEMFGDRLSPAMRRVTEDMRTHVIDLLNLLEPAPRTILHGDYRRDTVFFGPGGAIAAIDWQISTRRGVFDVAYFPARGSAGRSQGIGDGPAALARHRDGGGTKSKQYTFDAALDDYRRAALFCNVYTVMGGRLTRRTAGQRCSTRGSTAQYGHRGPERRQLMPR
jgi:aminoglycoside phosphotransferase (APT) family kinase protein